MEQLIELLMQAARRELAVSQPAASFPYLNQAIDLARRNGLENFELEALEVLARSQELAGDLGEAEQTLRTCLGKLEARADQPASARVLTALGKVLLLRGDLVPARESLRRALLLPSGLQPGPDRADSLEKLGLIERQLGETADALSCLEEALRIRHAIGDRAGTARNHGNIGNWLVQVGRLDEAREHFRQALALFQRAPGNESGMAIVYNSLGSLLLQQGDYAAAIENFELAERHFQVTGNRRHEARAMGNRGLLHSYRGEGRQAEVLLSKCVSILEEIDDRLGLVTQLNNLALVFRISGRNREAIDAARRSIELRQSLGQMEGLFKPWFNVAMGHLELDELSEAEAAASEVRILAQQSQSGEVQSEALILETSLAVYRKSWDEALARAREGESLAHQTGYPRQRAEAMRLRAEVHLQQGELESARESLLESESIFKSMPDSYHLALCQMQLGRLFGRIGAIEAAVDRLGSAADTFGGLLNAQLEWRARILLAEAQWPLSRTQALATLATAERIAAATGKPELATATAEVKARLVPGAASPRSGSDMEGVCGLLQELRRIRGNDRWLDRAVRSIQEFVGGEVFLLLETEPASETDPSGNAAMTRLLSEIREEARTEQAFRYRWLDTQDPRSFAAAVPLLDRERRPLGVLLALGRQSNVASVLDPPSASVGLRCAAEILALEIDAARDRDSVTWSGGRASIGSSAIAPHADPTGIVGQSAAIVRLRATVTQIAQSDAGVLLLGESGTGKEVVARAVHRLSARAAFPFVAISCPSIPRELIEAQLFGHERGAFTGAHQARPGQVELADKGVLFLDEIGDVDLGVQTKLLRFLEQREFQRVGGRETLQVDLRVLAATSRNLEDEIQRGRFREDLYYRIGVVPIQVPPLRDRAEDLPLLIAYFLRSFSDDAGGAPLEFDRSALSALSAYDWPGNVRELRNLIEHMVALYRGRVVSARDLPAKMKESKSSGSVPLDAEDLHQQLRPGETLDARLMTVEGTLLRQTLARCQGNQALAARLLGIKDSTLRSKLKKYRIQSPRSRGEDRRE